MKKKKEKVKTFTLPDLSTLTLKQCSILMVIAVICFLALKLKFLPYILTACLFTVPMVAGLVILNKDTAKKLIRLPKGRDFLYGFGFVIPSAVITMIVTVLLGVLGVIEQPKSNVIFEKLANDFWLTLAGTFIQLFGELCSCSAMDSISSWLSSTLPKRTKIPLVTALFHTCGSASGRKRILSR